MPLKLPGILGPLRKQAIDSLTLEQKRDRTAVFNAESEAIEDYIEQVLASLILAPVPALQTTVGLGAPTAPGPAPVAIGRFLK